VGGKKKSRLLSFRGSRVEGGVEKGNKIQGRRVARRWIGRLSTQKKSVRENGHVFLGIGVRRFGKGKRPSLVYTGWLARACRSEKGDSRHRLGGGNQMRPEMWNMGKRKAQRRKESGKGRIKAHHNEATQEGEHSILY